MVKKLDGTKNKRLKIIIMVLIMWFAMGVLAMFLKVDLSALGVYFSSGALPVLGWLWAETSRPAGFVPSTTPEGEKTLVAKEL